LKKEDSPPVRFALSRCRGRQVLLIVFSPETGKILYIRPFGQKQKVFLIGKLLIKVPSQEL